MLKDTESGKNEKFSQSINDFSMTMKSSLERKKSFSYYFCADVYRQTKKSLNITKQVKMKIIIDFFFQSINPISGELFEVLSPAGGGFVRTPPGISAV